MGFWLTAPIHPDERVCASLCQFYVLGIQVCCGILVCGSVPGALMSMGKMGIPDVDVDNDGNPSRVCRMTV